LPLARRQVRAIPRCSLIALTTAGGGPQALTSGAPEAGSAAKKPRRCIASPPTLPEVCAGKDGAHRLPRRQPRVAQPNKWFQKVVAFATFRHFSPRRIPLRDRFRFTTYSKRARLPVWVLHQNGFLTFQYISGSSIEQALLRRLTQMTDTTL
jgi:hypothetical protein